MSTSASNPVRTAIVGLGWWGKIMATLVHAGGAEMRFVHAVDPNPDARSFAADLGIRFSSDLASALADPDVEAVVLAISRRVASPPSPFRRRMRRPWQTGSAKSHPPCLS